MLTKEYLGEVALPLDDWFVAGKERSFLFGQSEQQSQYINHSASYFFLTYFCRFTVYLTQPCLYSREYS